MNLIAILGTSLAGSLHCVAMCGALAGLNHHPSWGKSLRSQLGYHLGRCIAYIGLGVLAGSFGQALEQLGTLFGLRWFAAGLILASIIVAALWALWPKKTLIQISNRSSERSILRRLRTFILRLREKVGPGSFGLALGLSTGFLPCGWLWSYLALASSTLDPWSGGMSMFAFWLGTIPALSFASALLHGLRRALGPMAPRLAALLVLGLASFNLAQHWPQEVLPSSTPSSSASCHHEQ